MPTKQDILAGALELSTTDRAELIRELTLSLDEEPDAEVEVAWTQEIQNRLADVMAGRAKTLSAEESLLRLDQAIARGRTAG